MHHFTSHSRDEFPERLSSIFDPPDCLFAWGNWDCINTPCLAIVGTRRCTRYGEKIAYEWSKAFAERGFTIVSGLAFGIDAAAHRGALDGGGKTVAVLAQHLAGLLPKNHMALAEEIVQKNGLILSERGGEFATLKSRGRIDYLIRNRLIAALSKGVLVVEAGIPSGAINTGQHAREMGRELMIVPGRIDDEMSRGCFKILRDGAECVTTPREVVERLGGTWTNRQIAVPTCCRPLLEQLQKRAASPAELSDIFRGVFSLSELYQHLSELELAGIIAMDRDQRFYPQMADSS